MTKIVQFNFRKKETSKAKVINYKGKECHLTSHAENLKQRYERVVGILHKHMGHVLEFSYSYLLHVLYVYMNSVMIKLIM